MAHTAFIDALAAHGIPCPPCELVGDDFTRWGEDKRYFGKPLGNGFAFGDWKTGLNENWFPDDGRELSSQELQERKRQIAAAFKEAEKQRMAQWEEKALEAQHSWEGFSISGASPYLQRKGVAAFGVRFDGDSVIVPLWDVAGKLWSLQRILADGNKRFFPKAKKKGCFHVLGNLTDATTVLLCEGYATAASVHQATSFPTLVAFDAGNLEPVAAEILKKYPSLNLVICGDDDAGKEQNIGREKAEATANKYGCKVIFPAFLQNSLNENPTDWNDLHQLCGLAEVTRQLNDFLNLAEPETPTTHQAKLPPAFKLTKHGLFYEEDWIASPLEILAFTRDGHSENWGRLLRFDDLDGVAHELAISMEMLSGDGNELFSLLLSLGLRITTSRGKRAKLLEFLQNVRLETRAICTAKIGWHDGYFILPSGAIPATDAVHFQGEGGLSSFRTQGTLAQWQQQIALPCVGNSRLVFALSCAFAAPLLPLSGIESGGFNFKGASSMGKSTALEVAASVWGGRDYVQAWRATGNALEAVAEGHNHALLCLDELGQVDGRDAGEIAYMLANGTGKNRMRSRGALRKKYSWQLLFLSTGEISLADKLNEAGKKPQAGMLTRLADIPADAGKGYKIFDTLGGFADGHTLAQHFKDMTSKYYGTASRAFLEEVAAMQKALPEILRNIQSDFIAQNVPTEADGQVKRVAARFALVAAGGELAIKLGILPFAVGDAMAACAICFKAWCDERGGTTAQEGEEAIAQVRAFFEAHHASRFALMSDGSCAAEKVPNLAGYKRKTENDTFEFFVFGEIFKKEVCKGLNLRSVCAELAEQGMLLRDSQGKYQTNQRLPIGQKRVYAFTPAILVEGA